MPPFFVAHVAGLKHLEIDSRVLLFTLAIAVLSGILAGVAPAIRFSPRSKVFPILKRSANASAKSLSTCLKKKPGDWVMLVISSRERSIPT